MDSNNRIDIIIPIYNQRNELIQCLSSIVAQSISFLCDVTIINDNSTDDYDDIINFFQKRISIFQVKINNNKGPGYARQLGINVTKNPYIIFIDADDILENTYAIEFLYGLMITKERPSAVFSSFVEECSNNKKIVHSKDNTWLFGKIYSRDFLNRNHIEFLDSRANEDKGFNCQVMLCSQKENENRIKYIDRITYCWKWNKESITRKNSFQYKKIDLFGFVDNTLFAIKKAKENNVPFYAIQNQSTLTMIYLYCRFLENLKTKDYTQSDFISFSKKFFQESYSQDKLAFEKNNEYLIFNSFLLKQKETFLKRKILIEKDFDDFSFQQFISLLN